MKLVLFVALLLFGCKHALASPPGKTPFTQGVYVFAFGKDGDWHRRVAKVEAIPNSLATVCFEMPKNGIVQCFWQEGDDTVVLATKLVGEEKT
jgi:hypothetical protein